MKKKIIAIFILLGISFSDGLLMVQAQEPFKGYIEETDLKNKEK